MAGLSPNLRWMLRHLVGTRARFFLWLLCQCIGFGLSILRLEWGLKQILDFGFWGLFTPVLFLITLRLLYVELTRTDAARP